MGTMAMGVVTTSIGSKGEPPRDSQIRISSAVMAESLASLAEVVGDLYAKLAPVRIESEPQAESISPQAVPPQRSKLASEIQEWNDRLSENVQSLKALYAQIDL